MKKVERITVQNPYLEYVNIFPFNIERSSLNFVIENEVT